MEMNFEPNSHKYNEEKMMDAIFTGENEEKEPEEKKIKPVAVASRKRKRSLAKRFGDIFFSENVGDVKTYLIYDVLVPAIKENVAELINSAVSMIFFGEASRLTRKNTGVSTGSRINYNAMSSPAKRERIPTYARSRLAHDFDEVVFETRAEAELVLDAIVDIFKDNGGQLSVAEFYDAAGMSTVFTDNKFGWQDLKGVHIAGSPSRGYYISMPRCIALE